MRILHVTNDYLDETGGISRHVEELTASQSQCDDVRIVYLTLSGRDGAAIDHLGRLVTCIPHRGGVWRRAASFPRQQLQQAIAGFRPQIVHVHTPLEALRIELASRACHFYTQHSSALDRILRSAVAGQVARRRLHRFDCLIAVSRSVRATLNWHPHVALIHNGVRWPAATSEERIAARRALFAKVGWQDLGETVLLFVGQLAPHKRCLAMIENNLTLLADRDAPVKVVIVGDGPERIAIESLLAKNAEIGYRCVGRVKPDEVRNYCLAADACVVPSQGETFGLVALEAMICGAVPLVRPTGGLTDFVEDGVNGLYLGADDALHPLLAVLRGSGVAGIRRAAIRHASERFSWETIAQQTRLEYTKSLQKVSPGTSCWH
jgi:glycosyltransferase involved in cell wall biosynthesis